MRFLAFDQSTRITGWAVIDRTSAGTFLVDSGTFKTSLNDVDMRIQELLKFSNTCVTSFNPDYIVLEDIQWGGNGDNTTRIKLAKCLGAMQGFHTYNGVKVKIMNINFWKAKFGITKCVSVSQKKETVAKVIKLFPHLAKDINFDKADAIAIGLVASMTIGG